MTEIRNPEDWDKFYYYGPRYKPKQYPKKYPCVAKHLTMGGGIMGEWEGHWVFYYPTTKDPKEIFDYCMKAEWEFIC